MWSVKIPHASLPVPGSTLTRFTATYDGEQWRDAGDNGPPYAQTMNFEYGFGTSFSSVTTWTAAGSSFNFTSPVSTATNGGPLDGNNAGRVADLGGTVSNLAWQSGTTLWIRWVEQNDLGADAGLGIDNFNFSATLTAVPEASGVILGLLICLSFATFSGIKRLAWKRQSGVPR